MKLAMLPTLYEPCKLSPTPLQNVQKGSLCAPAGDGHVHGRIRAASRRQPFSSKGERFVASGCLETLLDRPDRVSGFKFISSSTSVCKQSNVRKERRKKPDPPCVVCKGSGIIDCYYCQGRGRANCVHQVMLPKGEWPKWCKVCGGSGLEYCNRCLGTGEYRDIFGFHFMKINGNSS